MEKSHTTSRHQGVASGHIPRVTVATKLDLLKNKFVCIYRAVRPFTFSVNVRGRISLDQVTKKTTEQAMWLHNMNNYV